MIAGMLPTDLMTVGELSRRSGFAPSALRYYERQGLLSASRTSGGQRRYERHVLRRLAFIRAATAVGLSLDEVAEALSALPDTRTPTKADWTTISRHWRARLDEDIAALTALRDGLDACIGCGCLSLRRCRIANPQDRISARGSGAQALPVALRRAPQHHHGGHHPGPGGRASPPGRTGPTGPTGPLGTAPADPTVPRNLPEAADLHDDPCDDPSGTSWTGSCAPPGAAT
jgi:MerR family redox-sensitive transcriptional activator SoxR